MMPMPAKTRFIQGFIEHFTAEQAVILRCDRTTIQISRTHLPRNAREGDFIIQVDAAGHCRVDTEITEMHQRELRRMSDCYFG
jgi:hypothetical protein